MKYFKLRIVCSLACGVIAILFVALWVRSYSTLETLAGHLPGIDGISSTSVHGRVSVATQSATPPWNLNYHNVELDENSFGGGLNRPLDWFEFQRNEVGTLLTIPHGIIVTLFCFSVMLPWRFSLRTLLIGMTVAAVGLGLVVYFSGNGFTGEIRGGDDVGIKTPVSDEHAPDIDEGELDKMLKESHSADTQNK